MARGDPTANESCAGLSHLTIKVTLAERAAAGLAIEPLAIGTPLDTKDYQASPVQLDATDHVRIPFFSNGQALDFTLRLIPVSRSGARGVPFDLRVQAPALPGLHQWLHRNRWIANAVIALLVVSLALVLFGAPRFRRKPWV
jgi:hypothetical protein